MKKCIPELMWREQKQIQPIPVTGQTPIIVKDTTGTAMADMTKGKPTDRSPLLLFRARVYFLLVKTAAFHPGSTHSAAAISCSHPPVRVSSPVTGTVALPPVNASFL